MDFRRSRNSTPTLPHCVCVAATKGRVWHNPKSTPWGGPAAECMPPRFPHCVWVAAPEGARFALGRPGGETLSPRSGRVGHESNTVQARFMGLAHDFHHATIGHGRIGAQPYLGIWAALRRLPQGR